MHRFLTHLPLVCIALLVCASSLAAAEPLQVVIADGIGASFTAGSTDTFVSPLACPLTEITVLADEDLTLSQMNVTYTGPPPQPEIEFMGLGGGLHLLIFDQALLPCEWLGIHLRVEGQTSNVTSEHCLWIAHVPGDVNQDGEVDVRDATAWGHEFQDRGDPRLVDTNCDGTVNVRDATEFGRSFESWQTCTLPAGPECPPKPPRPPSECFGTLAIRIAGVIWKDDEQDMFTVVDGKPGGGDFGLFCIRVVDPNAAGRLFDLVIGLDITAFSLPVALGITSDVAVLPGNLRPGARTTPEFGPFPLLFGARIPFEFTGWVTADLTFQSRHNLSMYQCSDYPLFCVQPRP